MRNVDTFVETFPIRGKFEISRGARTEATVVRVAISSENGRGEIVTGYGECVPYARYGESPESVVAQIQSAAPFVETGADRELLQDVIEAGAARNGLDCALWDLEAKLSGTSVYELAGLESTAVQTLLSIGIDTPEVMAEHAAQGAAFGTLKLKVGSVDGLDVDLERVAAVREAAPEARIIVDANEGWSPDRVLPTLEALADVGVALVEQPVPAGRDQGIGEIEHVIPLCADESFHTLEQLDFVAERYECLNIKLDKTGGLTHALACLEAARQRGLQVMVGCMVSTSLSIAPTLLVAQGADLVDVDAPYLLARDREPGLRLGDTGLVTPRSGLWGG